MCSRVYSGVPDMDPQCAHSELKQHWCFKPLGWLFHMQLEIVVNRPFFSEWALVETRLELQWSKSFLTRSFYCGLSTLWKLLCLPSPEQHFYPFTLRVGQRIGFSSSVKEFPDGVNINKIGWNFSCLAGVLLLHFGFRGAFCQ